MPCYCPLKGWHGPGGRIVFQRLPGFGVPQDVPCGRCIGCKMEYARQWGMRCLHEAKMHRENSYVTLTYSDEYLPGGGSLSIRDVQLFMKRCRKLVEPYKMKFFLGAEYGEENARPHYHALLFGVGFGDKLYMGRNKRGEPLYTSGVLSRLWSSDGNTMGHCTIGDVTFDSAVYCAKYALKKLSVSDSSPDDAWSKYESRYVVYDADGVVWHREPEFATMSNGIGKSYYEKFGMEVRDNDSVIVNAREVRPPRYYDVLMKEVDERRYDVVKSERKLMAALNAGDNTSRRLQVKEKLARIAAKNSEKKL